MSFTRRSTGTEASDLRVAEEGVVTTRHEPGADEEPTLSVLSRHGSTEMTVRVPHLVASDTGLPREGERVYYLRLLDGTGILLGTAADDHGGYTTERQLAHTHSDAEVRFGEDGSVHVENADTSLTLDADGSVDIDVADGQQVTVDGGTNSVVYDLDVTYGTADGTEVVTDVQPVTTDTVLVPE